MFYLLLNVINQSFRVSKMFLEKILKFGSGYWYCSIIPPIILKPLLSDFAIQKQGYK